MMEFNTTGWKWIVAALCVAFVYVGLNNELKDYSSAIVGRRYLTVSSAAPAAKAVDGVQTLPDRSRVPVEVRPAAAAQWDAETVERLQNMTYITFGASRTWGAGLGPDRHLAYPWLLSKNVTNNAIRASGPEFPALCAYTMVQDLVPDVIVLEFYLDATRKLDKLALRLRQRFPDATIIFLRIWGPMQYLYKGESRGLKMFMEEHEFDSVWDPELGETILHETAAEDWKYAFKQEAIKAQDAAVDAVNGILYTMPQPSDGRVALAHYAPLFARDLVHLSPLGHEVVAENIRALIVERNVTQGQVTTQPWHSVDFCESWYESGYTTLKYDDSKIRMTKFSTDRSLEKYIEWNGKYALECPESVQWINLHNSHNATAEVFIRYMSQGPPPSFYPKTEILLDTEAKAGQGVMIDPVVYDYNHKVHVNKVESVGMIEPGPSVMRVMPQSFDQPLPFRITGIIIAPPDQAEDVLRKETWPTNTMNQ